MLLNNRSRRCMVAAVALPLFDTSARLDGINNLLCACLLSAVDGPAAACEQRSNLIRLACFYMSRKHEAC